MPAALPGLESVTPGRWAACLRLAIGYLGVAAILFACHKYAVIAPAGSHADEAPSAAE